MKIFQLLFIVFNVILSIYCQERYTEKQNIRPPLTVMQSEKIEQIKYFVREGYLDPIEPAWLELVGSLDPVSVDLREIVNYVMREVYLEELAELQDITLQVKQFNEEKREIRGHLDEIYFFIDNIRERVLASEILSNSNVSYEINQIIQKLRSVEEQNETTMIKLQLLMDKRQNAIKALSTIAQKSEDTQKEIIKNLK